VVAEIFGVDAVVVLVVVVAVLVGGTQIPKLARSLGSARSEFQKGIDESRRAVTAPESATPDAG
jgi:sec-independent protein translocase protein TatA